MSELYVAQAFLYQGRSSSPDDEGVTFRVDIPLLDEEERIARHLQTVEADAGIVFRGVPVSRRKKYGSTDASDQVDDSADIEFVTERIRRGETPFLTYLQSSLNGSQPIAYAWSQIAQSLTPDQDAGQGRESFLATSLLLWGRRAAVRRAAQATILSTLLAAEQGLLPGGFVTDYGVWRGFGNRAVFEALGFEGEEPVNGVEAFALEGDFGTVKDRLLQDAPWLRDAVDWESEAEHESL